ncbi:MAG: hypothetical protein Q9164_001442 [Protoblastenia rupestris]
MTTQTPNDPPLAPPNPNSIFQQLEAYPWSTDPEFQIGLRSILVSNPAAEQAEHLTLRARCFYFARKKGVPIDFSAYKAWRAQRKTSGDLINGIAPHIDPNSATAASSSAIERSPTLRHEPANGPAEPPAPYPTTFSQIVELISTDQPIPGIKDVPDIVLEGQSSQPMAGKRRKPWEKDECWGEGEGLRIVGQGPP